MATRQSTAERSASLQPRGCAALPSCHHAVHRACPTHSICDLCEPQLSKGGALVVSQAGGWLRAAREWGVCGTSGGGRCACWDYPTLASHGSGNDSCVCACICGAALTLKVLGGLGRRTACCCCCCSACGRGGCPDPAAAAAACAAAKRGRTRPRCACLCADAGTCCNAARMLCRQAVCAAPGTVQACVRANTPHTAAVCARARSGWGVAAAATSEGFGWS
jgi:hypothetical protein